MSLEKIVYYLVYFLSSLIIDCSILMICWNYGLSDFLYMQKMGIINAISIVILLRIFVLDKKPEQNNTKDIKIQTWDQN